MLKPLGNVELRFLEFLAQNEPMTVREAWERYGEQQGYVRTTVQQMMDRLRVKGYLERERSPRGWLYRALQSRSETQSTVVSRFVHEMLGGSVSPFVVYLTETRDLSEEDVRRLRELVEDMEGRR